MEKYDLLFQSVFKKNLAAEDAVSLLKKITAGHPYFSIAQFYLLQQSEKGSPEYKHQAKKTATLFNNNYWLNFQLLQADKLNKVDEQPPALEGTNSIDYDFSVDEKITAENINEEKIHSTEPAQPLKESDLPATVITDGPASTTDESSGAIAIQQPENEITGIVTSHPALEIIEVPFEENKTATAEEIIEAEINNTDAPAEKEETELPPIKLNIEIPNAIAADAPLFEPLHTTDYFASVGIKLSEEQKGADKLGKQLKSFTDWLKTMKKIHTDQLVQPGGAAEIEASNTDNKIQKLAEASNVDNEVITEAMADVLLQQGRTKKAIEVLEKLSLLNPTKSAFFAAKINQIKEQ